MQGSGRAGQGCVRRVRADTLVGLSAERGAGCSKISWQVPEARVAKAFLMALAVSGLCACTGTRAITEEAAHSAQALWPSSPSAVVQRLYQPGSGGRSRGSF